MEMIKGIGKALGGGSGGKDLVEVKLMIRRKFIIEALIKQQEFDTKEAMDKELKKTGEQ